MSPSQLLDRLQATAEAASRHPCPDVVAKVLPRLLSDLVHELRPVVSRFGVLMPAAFPSLELTAEAAHQALIDALAQPLRPPLPFV